MTLAPVPISGECGSCWECLQLPRRRSAPHTPYEEPSALAMPCATGAECAATSILGSSYSCPKFCKCQVPLGLPGQQAVAAGPSHMLLPVPTMVGSLRTLVRTCVGYHLVL